MWQPPSHVALTIPVALFQHEGMSCCTKYGWPKYAACMVPSIALVMKGQFFAFHLTLSVMLSVTGELMLFLVQGPKTGIYVPFAGKNRYTLGPSKTHTANPALGQTHALWRYYILSDCVALPEKGGVLPFRRHAQTLDTRRLPQTLDVCYTYSARHVGTRKRRFVVDNGMQSFFPHILGSRAALLANDHSSQVTVIQGVQDVLYIPVLHSIVSM